MGGEQDIRQIPHSRRVTRRFDKTILEDLPKTLAVALCRVAISERFMNPDPQTQVADIVWVGLQTPIDK
jgi:hypothetical protein